MESESQNFFSPRTGMGNNEDRSSFPGQKGIVIWMTGLSGSGKSTIAERVEEHLKASSKVVFRLDGDDLRSGINKDLGFSEADRTENIRRAAHIAALFRKAGIIVLCSFISPTQKMRDMARSIIGPGHFIEVYVKAGRAACAKRDPKGLYRANTQGLTGVSSPYEEPKSPDILLDTEVLSIGDSVDLVVCAILRSIDESLSNRDPKHSDDNQ
ncbi:MAG: adenylyl-sulfate kinase [Clostridiaceae bacterium]|nr:adenylyl-sulfate kinase [Clostridiaceae bacterium]